MAVLSEARYGLLTRCLLGCTQSKAREPLCMQRARQVCVCVCVCVERERERERVKARERERARARAAREREDLGASALTHALNDEEG